MFRIVVGNALLRRSNAASLAAWCGVLLSCSHSHVDQQATSPKSRQKQTDVVVVHHSLDRLVPIAWQQAAERFCCEDVSLAHWKDRSFYIPRLKLVENAAMPVVELEQGPSSLPYELHLALLMNRSFELPRGRISSVVVHGGVVVGIARGGHGGELLYIEQNGALHKLDNSDKSVEQVVLVDDESFAIVRQRDRSWNEVACFENIRGQWQEGFSYKAESSTVLGADDQGELVGANSLGLVFSLRCSGEVEDVARIAIGPAFDLRALSGTYKGKRRPCLLPAGDPTSVRRWPDGRIAVTLRHYVVMLEPQTGGGMSEQWFGRPEECDPRVFGPLVHQVNLSSGTADQE